MNDDGKTPVYHEIYLIAPMVVYLGYDDRLPAAVNPTDEELLGTTRRRKAHRYRCKHFDPKTRDCTIYEARPSMCRRYPYGKCKYAECTWADQREKKETLKQRQERRKALKAGGLELEKKKR